MGDRLMFGNLKVSTRLAMAFGVVVLLLVGVIALGISRMQRVNEGLRTITEENNVEIRHATTLRAAAFEVSISMRNLMLMTDDAQMKTEAATLHQSYQDFEAEASELDTLFTRIAGTTQTEKDILA